jgi:hypothetical protein
MEPSSASAAVPRNSRTLIAAKSKTIGSISCMICATVVALAITSFAKRRSARDRVMKNAGRSIWPITLNAWYPTHVRSTKSRESTATMPISRLCCDFDMYERQPM